MIIMNYNLICMKMKHYSMVYAFVSGCKGKTLGEINCGSDFFFLFSLFDLTVKKGQCKDKV